MSTPLPKRCSLLVGVVAAVALALTAGPAQAGPVGAGFKLLGNGDLALGGVAAGFPSSVMHDGQLYVANVLQDHERHELVVDRLIGDPGRWQRVGQTVLNVNIDADVVAPQLLSTGRGGDLYLAWIEREPLRAGVVHVHDFYSHFRLMVARLDESDRRHPSWRLVGGPGPAVKPTVLRARPMVLAGRLAVSFAGAQGGFAVGLPTEHGWQTVSLNLELDQMPHENWWLQDVASYGDRLYLLQHDDGAWSARAWRLAPARLGADNRLHQAGAPIAVAVTDNLERVSLLGRDGARPLLASRRRDDITVAELVPAGDAIATIARFSLNPAARLSALSVARLGDDIGVTLLSLDGGAVHMFRVRPGSASPQIRYDVTPDTNAREADLLAGPAGELVLTYLRGGARPMAVGFTPDGPSG